MRKPNNRLSYLFQRYYHGVATERETDELMELVRKSEHDEGLSELTKEAWDTLNETDQALPEAIKNRILNSIIPPLPTDHFEGEGDGGEIRDNGRRIGRWGKYAVAATVAFICISGAWLKWGNDGTGKADLTARVQPAIKPGGNRAMLTLADGSTVLLDEAADGLILRQGAIEINKVTDGYLEYKAAGNEHPANGNHTISTPRGGQYKIGLPDGSMVWLNASSSIRFPTGFSAVERKVEIEGEAFFDIKKDIRRPFKVIFGDNEVAVLGTKFNIANYPDEAVSRTTLVEGSVALKSGNKRNKLVPGQAASVGRDGTISIGPVDVEEVTAWKNNLFYFKGADIASIMQQVSRWYDIDIAYEGVLPKKQLAGKVPRNVELSEFMSMLQYAGINYRMEGRKMIIVP
ncbi:hypothetical protein GCM10023091_03960 [Ravibacter arvi]|uniref:FecR family protein n=1 Tax=Ravibacter arvi TaxID=2051041 RepID=A0ABP8LPR0_9BACT